MSGTGAATKRVKVRIMVVAVAFATSAVTAVGIEAFDIHAAKMLAIVAAGMFPLYIGAYRDYMGASS